MPPTQQKALVLLSKQGQLEIQTIDVPHPAAGQLLVKIEATALNPGDAKILRHALIPVPYPCVLGFDAAGTVVELGKGVSEFALGDRVLSQGWFDMSKGNTYGTFQQYVIIPTSIAAKIPANLSFEEAATLPSALATAIFPLYNQSADVSSARLTAPWAEGGKGKYAGKPFLILGGASSIGQYVIQLAKLSGFSPIITTASPHNAALLASLGATHVLDRKLPAAQLAAEVRRLAGGALPAVVYDAVSSEETLGVAYASTAERGDLVVVVGTPVPGAAEDAREGRPRVHMAYGIFRHDANEELGSACLAALPGYLEQGLIKPNRVEVLPGGLAGIEAGLDRLLSDQVSGVKLVVLPHA